MPSTADVFLRLRVDSAKVKADTEAGLSKVNTTAAGKKVGQDLGNSIGKELNKNGSKHGENFMTSFAKGLSVKGSLIGAAVTAGLASLPAAVAGVGVIGGIALGAGLVAGVVKSLKAQEKALDTEIAQLQAKVKKGTATSQDKAQLAQDRAQLALLDRQLSAYTGVTTALSNLKTTAIDVFGRTITPLLKPFETSLTGIGTWLRANQGMFKAFFASVAPYVPVITTFFEQLITTLLPIFTRLFQQAQPAVTKILTGFNDMVKTGVGGFFAQLGGHLGVSATAFVNILKVVGDLLPVLGALSGIAAELLARYPQIIPVFAGLVVALKGMLVITAVVEGFKKLSEATKAIKEFNLVSKLSFLTNPWVLLGLAVIAAAVLIVKYWGPISRFFIDIWNHVYSGFVTPLVNFFTKTIPHAFGDVVDFVKRNLGTIGPILAGVLAGPIGAIAALIISHWNTVKNVTVSVWRSIVSFFSGIGDGITGAFRSVVSFFDGVWHSIEGGFNRFKDFITSSFDTWWKANGDAVKDIWNTLWHGILDIVMPIWNGVVTTVKGGWNLITGAFSLGERLVSNASKLVWGGVLISAKAVWGAVTGFVRDSWAVIVAVFNAYKTMVVTEVKALWTAVVAVFRASAAIVSGIWDTLWAVAAGILRTAWAVIKAVVSTGWAVVRSLFQVAVTVIEGYVKVWWTGLEGIFRVAWALIEAIVKSAWDIIVGIFSVFINLITGHWSAAWNALRTMLQQVWNQMRAVVQTATSAISAVMDAAWNAIRNTAQSVWNGMRSVWSTFWGGIRSIADTAIGGLKGAFDAFWGGLKNGFSSAVSAIGTIWKSIQTIAAAPVHFVIDTVYNHGIVPVVDAIAGVVGLHPLNAINIGFAEGTSGAPAGWAWVGERGPELVRFSGGEQVLDNARSMATGLWGRGRGFAGGTSPIEERTGPGADISGPALGPLSGPIHAALSGLRNLFGDALAAGINTILNPLLNAIPGSSTGIGLFIKKDIQKVTADAVNWIKGKSAQVAATGPAGGVTGSEMANMIEGYRYLLANVFSGVKPAAAGATASIWGESTWNPFAQGTGGRGLIGWTPPGTISDAAFNGGMRTQLPAIIAFINSSGDWGVISQMKSAGASGASVTSLAEMWGQGVERYGIDDVHPQGVALATQIMNKYHNGGYIPEPVYGVGTRTGAGYAFNSGENVQTREVSMAQIERLDRLITLMEANNRLTAAVPKGIGRQVGGAMGAVADDVAFTSRYPGRRR